MTRYVRVHTEFTMSKGQADEQEIKVGEVFPVIDPLDNDDAAFVMSMFPFEVLLIDFGGEDRVGIFTVKPDHNGDSYANWLVLIEEEGI